MAAPMNRLFIVTEFVEKMGSLGLKTDSSQILTSLSQIYLTPVNIDQCKINIILKTTFLIGSCKLL